MSKFKSRTCCVKGCSNPPLPDRKTCGRHGGRRTSARISPSHFDRVLIPWREYSSAVPIGPIALRPLPAEQPYCADVAIRSNGSIVGLPTTIAGLKNLLSAWLRRPGCSLAALEQLTPALLPAVDRSVAICNVAHALVRFDLTRGGGA